ncbi:MAG: hypothetical protein ABID45_01870 [Patescibacteria group bacterium]
MSEGPCTGRPPGEDEKSQALARQLNAEILRLTQNNIPLEEIAELLGAENHLTIIESGKEDVKPVTRFDVQGFIRQRIAEGNLEPLKLPDDIEQIYDVILPPGEGDIVTGSGEGMGGSTFGMPAATSLRKLSVMAPISL